MTRQTCRSCRKYRRRALIGENRVQRVFRAFHGSRHRAVYRLVADLMPARIHALSLITSTPEELSSTNDKSNNRNLQ